MGIVTNPRIWRAPPPQKKAPPAVAIRPQGLCIAYCAYRQLPPKGPRAQAGYGVLLQGISPACPRCPRAWWAEMPMQPAFRSLKQIIARCIPKKPRPLVIASDTCRSGSGFPLSRTRRRYDFQFAA